MIEGLQETPKTGSKFGYKLIDLKYYCSILRMCSAPDSYKRVPPSATETVGNDLTLIPIAPATLATLLRIPLAFISNEKSFR